MFLFGIDPSKRTGIGLAFYISGDRLIVKCLVYSLGEFGDNNIRWGAVKWQPKSQIGRQELIL